MDLFLQGSALFFNIPNFLYMNLGLLLGVIFGAIPGLTVILCIVLFLPFTYSLGAVESFMFLLGIYCAGSYGGSISAILIKTPGTPHAAATMLDGYPLTQKGQSMKALNMALNASTFGGIFSAIILLFFAPQVSKLAQMMGTPEYFLVCTFGLTIIAGVSSNNIITGIITGALGLFISTIGIDAMSGGTRFIFNNINLYSGIELVIAVIGLFALSEILAKSEKQSITKPINVKELKNQKYKLTKDEKKRVKKPMIMSALIGVIIGVIPGTGASMASFFSYDRARKISKHPEEFGKGSVEGISACETANNAVTGATLIPLLTMGIPGDGAVAIMLGALMINGLTPGPKLFANHGPVMYAIMIGLIFVNLFMFIQGKFLTQWFARVITVPVSLLTPIIVMFCFAGAFSVNASFFDVKVSLFFGLIAYFINKVGFSTIPTLLGLVLGTLTEENFRRSLVLSDGKWNIFASSPICIVFLIIIAFSVFVLVKSQFVDKNNSSFHEEG